jgi:hypothetical protein
MKRTAYRRSFHLAAAAAAAAVVPLLADTRCASAQSTPIFGGPTYDEITGNGYRNAMFSNAVGVAVSSTGLAVGIADRYAAGIDKGGRAILLNAAGSAVELSGLAADPSATFESAAYSINAGGQSAGFSNKQVGGVNFGDRAVRWDAAGNPLELAHLGTNAAAFTNTYAYTINLSGQTAGSATKYVGGVDSGERAVRWDTAGNALELGNLGRSSAGSTSSEAYGINNAGQTAGYADKYVAGAFKGQRAVRWDVAGNARELGTLGTSNQGVTTAFAYAINASGQSVGQSAKYVGGATKGDRAVRWDAVTGAALELGNLGLDATGTTFAYAFAINNAGQTAGRAFKYVGTVSRGERAVRWDAAGNALELGHLGLSGAQSTSASALSINSLGETAGRSKKYVGGVDQGDRAVYWTVDGTAVDLNTRIDPASNWTLTRARAISDNGWVVGFGLFDPDGSGGPLAAYQRHFLLNVATENRWLSAAGGAWQTGGNWFTNFAPGASVDALFNLNAAYTVSLAAAGTAKNLVVRSDNVTLDLGGHSLAVGSVTVGRDAGDNAQLVTDGGGTLHLTGGLTVAANPGASGAYTLARGTLNAPAIAVNAGGTFTFAGGAINTASVHLSGDAVMQLSPGRNKTLRASTINIADASTLDLSDNQLITDDPVGSTTGGVYSGVQGTVQRAYNFGAWDQPGLTTSQELAGPNAGPLSGTTTIGVATAEQVLFIAPTETAMFAGYTVTGSSVIAMYTYAGDLNFDGLVDGADYGVIDNYVQFPGTDGYANGDFNYDGVIDGADYGVIDNTVQLQGEPFPSGTYGAPHPAAIVAVPEPGAAASALLLGSAAPLVRRRPRRHRRAGTVASAPSPTTGA